MCGELFNTSYDGWLNSTTAGGVMESGGAFFEGGYRVDSFYWWCQSGRTLTTLAVQAGNFSVLVIAVDR